MLRARAGLVLVLMPRLLLPLLLFKFVFLNASPADAYISRIYTLTV